MMIKWVDNSKTSILYSYEGDFTRDSFIDMIEQVNEMIESVPHKVDVIQDSRNVGQFQNGQNGHSQGIQQCIHQRAAQVIVVGTDLTGFDQPMKELYVQVFPGRMIFFETLGEAFKFIGLDTPV